METVQFCVDFDATDRLLRSALFWDVRQRMLVVIYWLLIQLIGPIFKDQSARNSSWTVQIQRSVFWRSCDSEHTKNTNSHLEYLSIFLWVWTFRDPVKTPNRLRHMHYSLLVPTDEEGKSTEVFKSCYQVICEWRLRAGEKNLVKSPLNQNDSFLKVRLGGHTVKMDCEAAVHVARHRHNV